MKTKNNKKNAVKRQLMQFFLLTFLFSWLMWLPGVLHTYNLIDPGQSLLKIMDIMNLAGGIGPSLIAFILVFKNEGKQGGKQLFKRLFKVKLGYWYFAIFLIMPVLLVLAHILNMVIFGASFPQNEFLTKPWLILAIFILFFIMQFSEEFGWRGYVLDRLQNRWNALVSSIILGSIWAIWHLPMFLSKAFPHYDYNLPFVQLFITLVTVSVFITWLQNNCKGSLIPAFVIHTIINISNEILPLIDKNKEFQGDYTVWIIINILSVIATILIVAIWGQKLIKDKNTNRD